MHRPTSYLRRRRTNGNTAYAALSLSTVVATLVVVVLAGAALALTVDGGDDTDTTGPGQIYDYKLITPVPSMATTAPAGPALLSSGATTAAVQTAQVEPAPVIGAPTSSSSAPVSTTPTPRPLEQPPVIPSPPPPPTRLPDGWPHPVPHVDLTRCTANPSRAAAAYGEPVEVHVLLAAPRGIGSYMALRDGNGYGWAPVGPTAMEVYLTAIVFGPNDNSSGLPEVPGTPHTFTVVDSTMSPLDCTVTIVPH